MGLQTITLGEVPSLPTIERFKGNEQFEDIVAIPTRKIKSAYVHWVKEFGQFIYCMGEGKNYDCICCKDNGNPQLRVVIPLLQYTPFGAGAVKTGNYGSPLTVKFLSMTRKDYMDKIVGMDETSKDISQRDIVIRTKTKSSPQGSFQELTFQAIEGEAMWRDGGEMEAEAMELLRSYVSLIEMSVATSMDEARYNEKKKLTLAGGDTPEVGAIADRRAAQEPSRIRSSAAASTRALPPAVDDEFNEMVAESSGRATKALPPARRQETVVDAEFEPVTKTPPVRRPVRQAAPPAEVEGYDELPEGKAEQEALPPKREVARRAPAPAASASPSSGGGMTDVDKLFG